MKIIVHMKPGEENNWTCKWCNEDVREINDSSDLFLTDKSDSILTLERLQSSPNHWHNEYVECWKHLAINIHET